MTAPATATSARFPPAVALVPGFFGFEHRGENTYFADRFVAGLRSVLEANGMSGIPVLSVSTLGIAGLAQRQNDLLTELRTLETPRGDSTLLGGPRSWHLVGHSTGGVDACMLERDEPLVGGTESGVRFSGSGWGEWSALIERVRSVTTIAAPHFGTGLADSPLARFAAGHPSAAAVGSAARALLDLARRGDLVSRIRFAMSATPGLAKMPYFLLQLSLMNELARDLRPEVLGPLSARPLRRSAEGRVFAVATVAPRPPDDHPDRLFRDMWRWTKEGRRGAAVSAPLEALLANPALRLPSQRGIALPPIEAGDNDGVVSTDCQVIGELIGVVVADHVDVLGRYRRTSLIDGKVIDPGLLTSGADFGDDEFFALLLRVGERIVRAIREDA